MSQVPLLKVDNLSKVFVNQSGLFRRQRKVAFYPLSFTLERGQTLALMGEAGSGKSTLAKVLAGVMPPTQGSIYIDGDKIEPGDDKKRCKLLRMIFQDPSTALNPRSRIGQILEAPLSLNTELDAEQRQALALDTLRMVGLLPDHYHFYPGMISTGQKQRVALARALILSPRIIVADEAISTLDLSVRSQIINLLLSLQSTLGLSYIIVANDLGVVRHISDQVILMHEGHVVEAGPTARVLANPQSEQGLRLLQSYNNEYRWHRG
ncbi:peptide ABC transporter ATP-binding protein [Zobellella denitrificans]|jgi:cationic peptide transport system ATP-binding protein|uniref:Peptide ABC transporter ATP-binding protein n=1 Tax=Zobellella denitrificans TaxID=347534 RepID=A0A231MYH7_9GAMM|nr:ATP-binding cassette domain-containing protein [Zobellella denitrificans]ATG73600.1 peptide ABC transporter ATP-binding protein [Zobellella denitrificans]OXS15291.1 peptide ABC transporter ATP-binding protein [Zobellella denitrificans]